MSKKREDIVDRLARLSEEDLKNLRKQAINADSTFVLDVEEALDRIYKNQAREQIEELRANPYFGATLPPPPVRPKLVDPRLSRSFYAGRLTRRNMPSRSYHAPQPIVSAPLVPPQALAEVYGVCAGAGSGAGAGVAAGAGAGSGSGAGVAAGADVAAHTVTSAATVAAPPSVATVPSPEVPSQHIQHVVPMDLTSDVPTHVPTTKKPKRKPLIDKLVSARQKNPENLLKTIASLLQSESKEISEADENGDNVLMQAIRRHDHVLVGKLLLAKNERGSKPHSWTTKLNAAGENALILSCKCASEDALHRQDYIEIVKILMHYCGYNQYLKNSDSGGHGALYYAIQSGSQELIEAVLNFHAVTQLDALREQESQTVLKLVEGNTALLEYFTQKCSDLGYNATNGKRNHKRSSGGASSPETESPTTEGEAPKSVSPPVLFSANKVIGVKRKAGCLEANDSDQENVPESLNGAGAGSGAGSNGVVAHSVNGTHEQASSQQVATKPTPMLTRAAKRAKLQG